MLYNVYAWGVNNLHQCSKEIVTHIKTPTQVTDKQCRVVASGDNHNLLIDENNALYGWGDNYTNQLGEYDEFVAKELVLIDDEREWVNISASTYHSAGIDTSNNLYIWGDNARNRIIDDSYKQVVKTPTLVAENVQYVECNGSFTVYIDNDNNLYFLGRLTFPQFGLSDESYQQTRDGRTGPKNIYLRKTPYLLMSSVKNVFTMSNCILAQDFNDEIFIMGHHPQVSEQYKDNGVNQRFTINHDVFREIPSVINFLPNKTIKKMYSNGIHILMLTDDNEVYGFGNNFHKQLLGQSTVNNIFSYITDNIDDISAGYLHSLFLTTDSRIYGCGSNTDKQLLDENKHMIKELTEISDDEFSYIYSGAYHNLALKGM